MTEPDRARLMEAASILRLEARSYYDTYKHEVDAETQVATLRGRKAYEKYYELNKIANELDIVAQGNL